MSNPSLLCVPYRFKTSTLYSQIPDSGLGDFTVTRSASNAATRVNAQGFIETVPDNVPRLDYPVGGITAGCPALLVEPTATNGIRNNSMVGAVAGSPGTLPTNWTAAESTPSIISRQIIGAGTENGIEYFDLRIFGNGAANGSVFIAFDSTTQIVASAGQVWVSSLYSKIVSGTAGTLVLNNRWGLAAGTFVGSSTQSIALTSQLTRFSFASTAPATTERVQPRLEIVIQNGVAYDFTVRIGYPQMELGSVATSVIPTTTTAITRGAEVVSNSGASSLIGQTEGTIYAEVAYSAIPITKGIIGITDGTASNRISVRLNSTTVITARIVVGGTSYDFNQSITAIPSSGTFKIALAYKANDYVFAFNGTTYASTTPRPVPATNAVTIGDSGLSDSFFNDRIRAAALYTTRLTNAQLQSLTQ